MNCNQHTRIAHRNYRDRINVNLSILNTNIGVFFLKLRRKTSSLILIDLIYLICISLILYSCTKHSPEDDAPIRSGHQPEIVDQHFHDGQLRPAIGVHTYQVFRANSTNPTSADGEKNRYNHSPMLSWFHGKFYLCYIASEWQEHGVPTQTYLTSSADGMNWDIPRLAFPAIEYEPGKSTIATQRMAFYVAPNDRLLVMTYLGIPYGETSNPNTGHGIGRAIREIYENGQLGPIHFIRYMESSGYTRENTAKWYPYYIDSKDTGFINACNALLDNKLMTEQWWEEERTKDGFFRMDDSQEGFECKGMCFYHRKDGKAVALWKQGYAALSDDEGQSWHKPVQIKSKPTANAKEWGQKTEDGRYAILYIPMPRTNLRWPLGVITGDDGIYFDNLLVVQTEVPPQRFDGTYKNLATNYIRGIAEGNGNPPGTDIWATFSMNKEDLWVVKVPVPIVGKTQKQVNDDFEDPNSLDVWNIYNPVWATVGIEKKEDNFCLKFTDKERYDYAKAVRVFPETGKATISFKIFIEEQKDGHFEIDVTDGNGTRAIRMQFLWNWSILRVYNGYGIAFRRYPTKEWVPIEIKVNAKTGKYDMMLDGEVLVENGDFYHKTEKTLERIEFRTGKYRRENNMVYSHEVESEIALPLADDPTTEAIYYIDDLIISSR